MLTRLVIFVVAHVVLVGSSLAVSKVASGTHGSIVLSEATNSDRAD